MLLVEVNWGGLAGAQGPPLHSALEYRSDVHTSSLRSVCFSPEGLYLATVADDR